MKPIMNAEHEASESPAIEKMEKASGKEMGKMGTPLKGGNHKSAKATEKAKPPVKKAGKVGPKFNSIDALLKHRKEKYGV